MKVIHTVASVIVVMLVLSLVYLGLRMRTFYYLQKDLTAMRAEVVELHKETTAKDAEIATRLDDLERVLFGDVIVKLDKAPEPTSQTWQLNREKELQKRLTELEYWRREVDRKLER